MQPLFSLKFDAVLCVAVFVVIVILLLLLLLLLLFCLHDLNSKIY